MARHIMAVCVVCLICAEHLPCKEHIFKDEDHLKTVLTNQFNNVLVGNTASRTANTLPTSTIGEARRIQSFYEKQKHKSKVKRQIIEHDHDHDHSHDAHDHEEHKHDENLQLSGKSNSNIFIKEIFKKFGDPDNMQMNVTGFEKMLTDLGLFKLVTETLDANKATDKPKVIDGINHSITSAIAENSGSCINSLHMISTLPSGDQLKQEKITKLLESYKNKGTDSVLEQESTLNASTTNANDTTPAHLNETMKLQEIKENVIINTKDLWTMCPILLYQLVAPTSRERNGCIQNSLLPLKFDPSTFLDHLISESRGHQDDEEMMEDRTLVWLYASLSILGVSLCGLLGVAVIPCMDKHFYQHIIQFLVALAVGTLTGDALLHLLPHAMMMVEENQDPHLSMTFKGLAAVFGIVFFYFMERFLNVLTEWWQKRQKKDKVNSRVRVIRDPESVSLNGVVPHPKDKYTCKHKYSSYPYCYDEIAMETKDDHHEHHKVETASLKLNHNSHSHNHNLKSHADVAGGLDGIVANNKCRNHGEHGDHLLIPGGEVDLTKDSPIDEELLNNHDTNTISTNCDEGSIERKKAAANKPLIPEESYTIILREHESKHHGHSHTHGHVHSPPDSLSAVAWMVIMGDGLHNFTDGMAIGAAFSNNIAGGFSTSIAVFCHELPHELGDFAVLLKAGMSAKQAVYYNMLSSVLSFFGMLVGVCVGDTPAASAWIFALAAGMFLYIALVDMLPELTSSHGKDERCIKSQFALQFVGMAVGFGTMLLIAIYEHDLKEMFSSSDGHDHHHHHHHHHH